MDVPNQPLAKADITLVGLGPGDPELLTRQAWRVLQDADHLFLRTHKHPITSWLPESLKVTSFDELYEQSDSFAEVYERIVNQIVEHGQQSGAVIYGVPGHPFVAEATSLMIVERAQEAGLEIEIVQGLSFLEPAFSLLGVDPFPRMSLVDAIELGQAYAPTFPPDSPALIAQIYSQRVASEVKLSLMQQYPDEHPVRLVHGAGTAGGFIEECRLYEIDRSTRIDLVTCLYLPPLGASTSFESFQEIIAHLRSPEGCPWDREQTHLSLRTYLLEEAYETVEALDSEDPQALQEELGDLLIQIVLHAQIASERGDFTMADVLKGVHGKLVYRHPHVFGDVHVGGSADVKANWERLKKNEKKDKGLSDPSVLDGVAASLPALAMAETYQKRAAKAGFDWPAMEGVVRKVIEEMHELAAAPDIKTREGEVGDLLFAAVNLARWHGVDPELALRNASLRFKKRFQLVERTVQRLGREIGELSLKELDDLWEQAKLNLNEIM